jgi:cytochrome oxidase Cu insertion factor (SCO1/SenC/PrrC family)
LTVGALTLTLTLAGCGGASTPTRSDTAGQDVATSAQSGFAGAALPDGGVRAEDFTLRDERGARVSLRDYGGRVVVLAFLYPTCGATCVLIAQQIRGALDELDEAHARAPAVLIVSANPAADSRMRVEAFLARTSLRARALYLTGPEAALRPIWRAYRVTPASAGAAAFDRFASVLLIDGRGRERVIFQQEQLTPEALAHDVARLQAG